MIMPRFFAGKRENVANLLLPVILILSLIAIFNALTGASHPPGANGAYWRGGDKTVLIGGFDLSRGQNLSLPEGIFFEDARAAIAEAYPAITYTAFPTLTETVLPDVDILILSSATDAQAAITPLSSAEQTVLYNFVAGGGCAILLPDNDTFDPNAPLANQSLIDPFGLAISGTIMNIVIAPVTDPPASPITDGPHGLVTEITQGWPGGLTDLGPYAISLATNPLGEALAVIEPGVLNPTAGAVVIYSDVSTFADFGDNGNFPDNKEIFLNSINYCFPAPPPPTATPSPTVTATPSATPTTPPLDLTIEKVEITQGIQCLDNTECADNSVPLVAGKATYVRVYVGVNGVGAPVANVTGEVTVQMDGWTYPAIPLNPTITAPLNPNRARYNHTLNFYIYGDVVTTTTTLTARVNPDQSIPESDYGNNSSTEPLNFVKTPKFTVVPIWVKAKNHQTGNIESVDPFMHYYLTAYAENLLPVSDINWLIPANPYLVWNNPTNPTKNDWGKLLALLNDLRKKNNAALTADAHYYGLVSTKISHGGFAGYGSLPGYAAAGQTEEFPANLENGADNMVHELGHNFNRKHVNCGNPDNTDPDYPYNVNQIGDFGWDPQIGGGGKVLNIPNGFVVPRTARDVMSYCQDEWISEYTYQAILNYRGSTPSTAVQPATPLPAQPVNTTPYLFFSGLLENGQTTLFPATILEQPSGSNDDPGTGTYALRLVAADTSILFERQFEPTELDGRPMTGSANNMSQADLFMFYEIMPWFTATVQVELWQGTTLLAIKSVSASAPQVTLSAGQPTWTAGGNYTISWQGSDADGDSLAYDVAFSQDGGQSWQMIATRLMTTSLTVSGGDFPGTDTAMLRVYVTDGILTAEDTGTLFTIADKPPTAAIISPIDNAYFPADQPILLKGMAHDWEDGFLAAAAFEWHSSLDGDLGSGDELMVTSLSPGLHLITLTVTDSDNQQATAQVTIYVGITAVFMPAIHRP